MNQERHQRLKIPIHKLEGKTVAAIFKQFPILRRYLSDADLKIKHWEPRINHELQTLEPTDEITEVKAGPNIGGDLMAKLIIYIVLLYDEGTDLTDEYPDDVRLRKEAAAKEAGFKRQRDGTWPQFVTDVMEFRDFTAVSFILQFLKAQGNSVWRELKMVEEELEALYNKRAEMIATNDLTSKNDLLEVTKRRNDEKEDLIKKFYGAHHDLRDATEKVLLPISPENVFSEMDFPVEFTGITQIKDVPQEARPH